MVKITFCSAKDCKEFAWCHNLCFKHYTQLWWHDGFTPSYVTKIGKCSYEDCPNRIVAKRLCWKHYRRQLRSDYKRATYACLIFHSFPYWLDYLQDHPMPELNFDDLEKPKKVRRIPTPPYPNAKPCSIPGCDDYARRRGICNRHYQYMQYHGTLPPKPVKPADCSIDGCNKARRAKGLCDKHYSRLKRHGTTDPVRLDGRSAKERHSMTSSREYQSWASMIQRCYNPKSKAYKNYGGRGITVCERWRSFTSFYADMGERPEGRSIHRIDVNGNYEPGNCKWATASEQSRHQRLHKNNTSGYRGIHFDHGKWTAAVCIDSKTAYLGRYKTKEEAARTYNQAALVHRGPEAMLNAV